MLGDCRAHTMNLVGRQNYVALGSSRVLRVLFIIGCVYENLIYLQASGMKSKHVTAV